MNLQFKWSRLNELTTLELYEMIRARESVFVVEQNCAYQETDEMDLCAWHCLVFIQGELAAYARVVDPNIKYEEPSIGRVMTVKKYRHLTLGRKLVKEAIRFTTTQFPNYGIKIGAQLYLQKFYQSFGFKPLGEPYDEDGIMHLDMYRTVSGIVEKSEKIKSIT